MLKTPMNPIREELRAVRQDWRKAEPTGKFVYLCLLALYLTVIAGVVWAFSGCAHAYRDPDTGQQGVACVVPYGVNSCNKIIDVKRYHNTDN